MSVKLASIYRCLKGLEPGRNLFTGFRGPISPRVVGFSSLRI